MPAATRDQPGLAAQLSRLQDWVTENSGLPCLVGEPAAKAAERPARYVQLEVIRVEAPSFSSDQGLSRVNAQVLVGVRGTDAAADADALVHLMLHVLSGGTWDLVPGQPDLPLWAALGRPPTPAFMVLTPVTLAVHRDEAPPVRHPIEVRGGAVRRIQGRVLAADGTALAGARVRMHPNGSAVTSSHDGRWAMNVPASGARLDVWARGSQMTYELGRAAEPSADHKIDIVLADVGRTPPPGQDPTPTEDPSPPDRAATARTGEETES